ncbi:hypothetical protein ACQJBY_017433 [Aegilops geniculata]
MKLARTTQISFPQSPQLASGMQSTPASGGALRMQRWMETRLTHTMMLVRSVADSNDMPPEDISDATGKEGDAEGMFVSNSNGSSWTRRTRIGKGAYKREINPSRVPALEVSIRAYTDQKKLVMIQLGLQEVPRKHVLKRWTREARYILPAALPEGSRSSEVHFTET